MSPQIPGYLLIFEATVRPLVAAIALGLIWIGAVRMEAPAATRYTTAAGLSIALIVWLVIAQQSARQICISRPPRTRCPLFCSVC
jgi:hypothetical protein